MRMVHYYLVLAGICLPTLLATLVTGIWYAGQTHTGLGLFTAMLCVGTNTLLILFMIVTGRVLKAAMQSRPLGPEFLVELNEFFARKKAYPMALLGATLAVATAVLGHGTFIGVPITVHLGLGLATFVFHMWSVPASYRTLQLNQELLDRATRELDRLDRESPPQGPEPPPVAWAYGPRIRWTIFALSAWLPYLYWGLVVWRGDFASVSAGFLALTALASTLGLAAAVRARQA